MKSSSVRQRAGDAQTRNYLPFRAHAHTYPAMLGCAPRGSCRLDWEAVARPIYSLNECAAAVLGLAIEPNGFHP